MPFVPNDDALVSRCYCSEVRQCTGIRADVTEVLSLYPMSPYNCCPYDQVRTVLDGHCVVATLSALSRILGKSTLPYRSQQGCCALVHCLFMVQVIGKVSMEVIPLYRSRQVRCGTSADTMKEACWRQATQALARTVIWTGLMCQGTCHLGTSSGFMTHPSLFPNGCSAFTEAMLKPS